LARHLYEDALNRMQERMTPEAMRLRRSTVEHPFATIKYRIFGHPRLVETQQTTLTTPSTAQLALRISVQQSM
jgi:hypothetical protein